MQENTRSSFVKQVVALSSGTAVAQVVGFTVTPIITRLYSADEYALFGIFSSWLMVLAYLICGKFPMALVASPSDDDAKNIRALSWLMASFWIGLIVVVMAVFGDPPDEWWLLLLPLALVFNGWQQIEYGWALRKRAYKFMAWSRIVQTAITSGSQVLVGLFWKQSRALILAVILGLGVASLVLRIGVWKGEEYKWDLKAISAIFRDNLSYPLMSMPAELLRTVSFMMPGLLLPFFGVKTEIAFVFLAFKVTNLPLVLISQAVGNVFLKRATDIDKDQVLSVVLRMSRTLLLIVLPPAVLLSFWAPELFGLVFGSKWAEAGLYQRWLLLWFVPQFVVFPLASIYDAMKTHKSYLLISLVSVLAQAVALVWVNQYYKSTLMAVAAYSIVGALGAVVFFLDIVRIGIRCRSKPQS